MNPTAINTTDQEHTSSVMMGVILAAWAILAVWSLSPYASLLEHHTIGEGELPPAIRLGLFLCGWFLMVLAMMLPTSFLFRNQRNAKITRHTWRLGFPVVYLTGYLAVWIAFGGFIYLGDVVLHELVEHSEFLETLSVGIFWTLLLVVGGFQFTSIKRLCLYMDHPTHFSQDADIGSQAKVSTMVQGIKHGIYCLGSCGTLMLLMFAADRMNLLVMLGLTGVMIAEQVAPVRWQFSRLVGLCLIALAFLDMMKKIT